jgi:hypothetical protein
MRCHGHVARDKGVDSDNGKKARDQIYWRGLFFVIHFLVIHSDGANQ